MTIFMRRGIERYRAAGSSHISDLEIIVWLFANWGGQAIFGLSGKQ